MTAAYDIAVIGGGVIGFTLARRLAAESISLCVIDASQTIPPATNAAAGMLAPSFEESLGGEALYELSAENLRLWPDFAASLQKESGADIDFRQDGILGVAFSGDQENQLAVKYGELAKRGATVRLVDGDGARTLEPSLSENIFAAMEAPKDAQVDPAKLLVALQSSLESRSADFVGGMLLNAMRQNNAWRLTLNDKRIIDAKEIVIATGASGEWPFEGVSRPPIFPVKGEALAVSAPSSFLKRVVRGPGAYLCPKAGGRLVIGATELPQAGDLIVSATSIAELKSAATETAPGVSACSELSRWAGLRPATPDGAPILGRAGEGAWLALGHYRNGVLLAPASAEALAAEILGKTPDFDLRPFSPDRFG